MTARTIFCITHQHIFEFLPGMTVPPDEPPLPCGYELIYPYTLAGPETLELFPDAAKRYEHLCRWVERGTRIAVIATEGKIAHHCVVHTGRTASLSYAPNSLALVEGQVCVKYAETPPAERGRGLWPAALRGVIRHEQSQEGFAGALTWTTSDNVASMRGMVKAGCVYQKSARVISLGGGRVWYSRTFYVTKTPPVK